MRSPETSFALGLALLLILFVGLGSVPVAAETFPTDTTKLQLTKVLYDYDVLASWRRIDSTFSTDAGLKINKIEAGIMIDADYASTSAAAIGNTRVHATITSPDNVVVFIGFLTEIGWQPGNINGAWGMSRLQHFPTHWLAEGTYTITVVYDILIGNTWTHVDTATHFMICSYPEEPPDIPSEAEPSTWLPVMLSFAVIAGMTFIGFNLARRRDPTPALFMMFVGATLSWSIGWLPTWIFVTAIALISLSGAALWGKWFRGR